MEVCAGCQCMATERPCKGTRSSHLVVARTNPSAPLPRAPPNRVQPSQSRARVVGRALCKGEALGHVAGGSWPGCHGAPEHSPGISLLPASSRWFLGGKVPGHVTHQVLLTVFALAPRPHLETGRAEPHRDTESGTKPNGNEGNVSFFFFLPLEILGCHLASPGGWQTPDGAVSAGRDAAVLFFPWTRCFCHAGWPARVSAALMAPTWQQYSALDDCN